jgi:hypothetical protein
MRPSLLIASLLILATTSVAAAQDFTRRSFAFFERQLAIEVDPVAPGTLHIVRGDQGRLVISGRSAGGFAGYGLSGHTRDRLRLTPVGARRAEYMVVVPEHVRVRLRLPDGLVDVPGWESSTSWEWEARAERAARRGVSLATSPGGFSVAFHAPAATAPRTLTLVDAGRLHLLEVRIAGDDFSVATSRELPVHALDAARVEVRVTGVGGALIVTVPASADFTLLADDGEVLEVRAGRGTTTCEPVTIQRLAAEERYSFTPVQGRLNCR